MLYPTFNLVYNIYSITSKITNLCTTLLGIKDALTQEEHATMVPELLNVHSFDFPLGSRTVKLMQQISALSFEKFYCLSWGLWSEGMELYRVDPLYSPITTDSLVVTSQNEKTSPLGSKKSIDISEKRFTAMFLAKVNILHERSCR